MYAYDDEPIDEFDLEFKQERHVMTKEEFVTRLTADLAARKKEREKLAKKQEYENRSYIIDRMIYNRKKRNRR